MELLKGWMRSKTRLGALLLAITAFLPQVGVHVDPNLQKALEALIAWGLRDAIAKVK